MNVIGAPPHTTMAHCALGAGMLRVKSKRIDTHHGLATRLAKRDDGNAILVGNAKS